MKSVGIFICNYNKKEYVVNCVKSVFEQKTQNYDVYVVDNASTDGSVEALRSVYGESLNIIENKVNLGGSGGFNAGIRRGLQENYKYIMLVDNDVYMDVNAVGALYDYMETHADVGIVGSKILQMKYPDLVQDLGGKINYEKYTMEGNYFGHIDEDLPEVLEMDYISTCSAMARTDAIKKCGIMPEENFIYWDDVEWSKKFQLQGYKTVAYGKSIVWHNHSIGGSPTPFVKYYATRNRLYFFSKYLDEKMLNDFTKKIVDELFSTIYGCNYKKLNNVANATLYAIEDFVADKRGKTEEGRIFPVQNVTDPFLKLLESKNKILIELHTLDEKNDEEFWIFCIIMSKIQQHGISPEIVLSLENVDISAENFYEKLDQYWKQKDEDKFKFDIVKETSGLKYDLKINLCNHVKNIKQNILPAVYVDGYCNCIASESDYTYFTNYYVELDLFKEKYLDLIKNRMEQIREAK